MHIHGTPVVGASLEARPWDWGSASPVHVAMHWMRCDGGLCKSIPEATGASYIVTSADVGHRLEVRAVAQNPFGAAAAEVRAAP